jgi:hypothetical protein
MKNNNPNKPRSGIPALPADLAPLPLFSRETRTVFRAGSGGKGGKGRRTRKGSVLILVVAILVLLALMGTAYITSTRNDRAASTVAGSATSVDTVAQGIIDTLKSRLANERLQAPIPTGSTLSYTGLTLANPITGFAARGTNGTLSTFSGSTLVASRVPTLSSTNSGSFPGDSTGKLVGWFSITSPLDGTGLGNPGQFENPMAGVNVTATFGTTSVTAAMSTNTWWGRSVVSRTNVQAGSVKAANGQVYPAFLVAASTDNFSGSNVVTVAADADGDGIADSGLVRIGNIPSPQYGDVTFYYGLRVIDNNSAFNANTAWTSGQDLDFAGTGVRNNRLFPGAIALKESLLRSGSTGNTVDAVDDNTANFQAYRAGVYNTRNGDVALQGDNTPFGDYNPNNSYRASTLAQPYTRNDFTFTTQQELLWSQLGMRVSAPGMHGTNATSPTFAFQTFTLDEQAQLASRFVVAPYSAGDSFSTARLKRTPLEQLLPGSLYRLAVSGVTGYGYIPDKAYSPSAVGATSTMGTFDYSSSTWFGQNFDYEKPLAGANANPLTLANLRPLLVARNPVSQSTTFKPLPGSAVLASSVFTNDRMTPYVPYFDSTRAYLPGEVVFFSNSAAGVASGPRYYVNAHTQPINANITPSNTTVASDPSKVTAAIPWLEYTGPVVPTKVNVNTADFGDLWRAYYLAMSSDAIDPANSTNDSGALPYSRNGTISPFGEPYNGTTTTFDVLSTTPEELYRGMGFTRVAGYETLPPPALLEGDNANPTKLTAKLPAVTGTDTATQTGTTQTTYHPQRQFRSKLKDLATTGNAVIPPAEMVKLRAAQAAVNAEYLRKLNGASPTSTAQGHDDIVRRHIPLDIAFGAATGTVMAEVYSHGRNLYITEVYASTAAASGGGNYVALELHNPYPFPISLENYRLEVIERSQSAAVTTTGRPGKTLFTFGGGTNQTVPANGYVVIENTVGLYGPATAGTSGTYGGGVAATVRPPGTGMTGTNAGSASILAVPALEAALTSGGQELVLSRPMYADFDATGTLVCVSDANANSRVTGTIVTGQAGSEGTEYYVPVDSIDFAGVRTAGTTPDDSVDWPTAANPANTNTRNRHREYAYDYHYARDTNDWHFVYPGRYDGRSSMVGPKQQGMREALRRSVYKLTDGVIGTDEPEPIDDTSFTTPAPTFGAANTTSTYDQSLTIQIANVGFGGLNATVTNNSTNANRFPFGGLTRELDLLQIPFISPVRLRPTAALTPGNEYYIDVISLTQDAAFAEDSDTRDNAEENVGRFAPIVTPATTTAGSYFYDDPSNTGVPYIINEFSPDTRKQRYGWANKLLDHLTVRSARDFSMPMAKGAVATATVYSQDNYPLNSTGATTPPDNTPQPAPNSNATFDVPNQLSGYDAGIEGQININTAPLPVLSAVPWVNTGTVVNDRKDNIAIAKAIIAEREARGPFRSLFELNRVKGFRTMNQNDFKVATLLNISAWGTEPADVALGTNAAFTSIAFRTNDNGDFSPPSAGTYPSNMATPSPTYPGVYNATANTEGAPRNRNPVNDYEAQYLALTAVSNLLTTRSDTFTAYLVIEGWRNAGTPTATRVVQRRFAFILDRTGVASAIPAPLLNGDPGTAGAVNVSNSATFMPAPAGVALPRPIQNSIRVTPVPVP